MKKIAFIITVYKKDSLKYFIESIESIFNQDYGFDNINIYLGIDGDLGNNEIKNYITKNSHYFYKIVQNECNQGLAYTLNRLIEQLEEEEYIFRMDSDDICRYDRVNKQLDFFASNKDVMVLGSDLIEIDENGNELRTKKMPTVYRDIISYSIVRSPLNHPTVAFRKEFFQLVGLYNESFIKAQDYELWSRALQQGIIISNINQQLLFFRIPSDYMHKRNSSASYVNEFKVSISLMDHFKMYGQLPKILSKLIIRVMPPFVGKLAYKIVRK